MIGAALLNNALYAIVAYALTKLLLDPIARCVTLERFIRLAVACGAGIMVLWALGPDGDEIDQLRGRLYAYI